MAALVTIVIVGPVMLAVYLLLLKLLRVSELSDLLQPLLGRLRRRPEAEPAAGLPDGATATRTQPDRATVSADSGLIPSISGEFDAASFRAGPDLDEGHERAGAGPVGGPLQAEDAPSSAEDVPGRGDGPVPGRRTYQGPAGQNPYFPPGGKKKK